jgi:hypothetical protein
MKYFNVASKETFTDKTGAEKTKWLQVGTLRMTDDGKKFLTLNMFPNETYYIFEQEQREPTQQPMTTASPVQPIRADELPNFNERFNFNKPETTQPENPLNNRYDN